MEKLILINEYDTRNDKLINIVEQTNQNISMNKEKQYSMIKNLK